MNEDLPYIPNIDVLNPPQTIFDVPVAEIPYLDPSLFPSLEQIDSVLGEESSSSSEEETSSSKEGVSQLKQETIPTDQLIPKDLLSTEEPVATFNIPFFGEMPIPSPEVIASSLIASGVSATAAVTGSIVLQSVINQLKKIMTKIFKKVLKKEIANQKKDQDSGAPNS